MRIHAQDRTESVAITVGKALRSKRLKLAFCSLCVVTQVGISGLPCCVAAYLEKLLKCERI